MSSVNHATGPKAAQRTFAQPQETNTTQPLAEESTSAGFGDAVDIELSDDAEEGAVDRKPGKAAYAPAHQARAFLAERAALAEGEAGETVPFGQIVSRIARGIDPAEAFAPPPADETGTTEGPEAASSDAVVADLLDELVEEEEEEAQSA